MAGITLAIAEARLTVYLAAEEAAIGGQSYEIESLSGTRRKLTRADLGEIRKGITHWQGIVDAKTRAARGGTRTRYMAG